MDVGWPFLLTKDVGYVIWTYEARFLQSINSCFIVKGLWQIWKKLGWINQWRDVASAIGPVLTSDSECSRFSWHHKSVFHFVAFIYIYIHIRFRVLKGTLPSRIWCSTSQCLVIAYWSLIFGTFRIDLQTGCRKFAPPGNRQRLYCLRRDLAGWTLISQDPWEITGQHGQFSPLLINGLLLITGNIWEIPVVSK